MCFNIHGYYGTYKHINTHADTHYVRLNRFNSQRIHLPRLLHPIINHALHVQGIPSSKTVLVTGVYACQSTWQIKQIAFASRLRSSLSSLVALLIIPKSWICQSHQNTIISTEVSFLMPGKEKKRNRKENRKEVYYMYIYVYMYTAKSTFVNAMPDGSYLKI